MSKVFRDFEKNTCMQIAAIASIILIITTITVFGIIFTSNSNSDIAEVENTLDKELTPNEELTPEIQDKIDNIEKTNLENKYTPKEREWLTSGPFQIDRSEYLLGEKIFLRINDLEYNEKGQVVFLKPSNSTHYSVYWTISFDGANRAAFNQYLEPDLSKIRGYCTVDDLIGDWRVVFRGTDYPNLEFKITEEILPGDEEEYEPVC